MITRRLIGPLIVLFSSSLFACSSPAEEESEVALGAASSDVEVPIGVATGPIFGRGVYGSELELEVVPGAFESKGPTVKRPGSPSGGVFTGYPKLEEWDYAKQASGFKGIWTCRKAQKFVGAPEKAPSAQRCYIELNTTANDGASVTFFGLGYKDSGFVSKASAPKPTGTVQRISAGPPRAVNVTIDHDGVVAALKQLNTQFMVTGATNEGERNVCIKNARGGVWLDIQAHYYCHLPLGVRGCFTRTLTDLVGKKDPAAPVKAYSQCFEKATPGSGEAWVHANQEAVFKYIMFTQQGTYDFDLASEQTTINDFYASVKSTRPRRAYDTYPEWAYDQPRYEGIRAAQAKGAAAAKTP